MEWMPSSSRPSAARRSAGSSWGLNRSLGRSTRMVKGWAARPNVPRPGSARAVADPYRRAGKATTWRPAWARSMPPSSSRRWLWPVSSRSAGSRSARTPTQSTDEALGGAPRASLIPGLAQPLRLGQAEPVAGVVPEQRLDPVRPLGRFLQEGDAPRRELLEGLPAVGGLEHAAAERALGDQRPDRLGVPRAEHRRGGVGEKDVQVFLVRWPDGQPAEPVEHHIAAQLEPQALGVEGLGAILVEHEHADVVEAADHRCSFGCGSTSTVAGLRPVVLLPDC